MGPAQVVRSLEPCCAHVGAILGQVAPGNALIFWLCTSMLASKSWAPNLSPIRPLLEPIITERPSARGLFRRFRCRSAMRSLLETPLGDAILVPTWRQEAAKRLQLGTKFCPRCSDVGPEWATEVTVSKTPRGSRDKDGKTLSKSCQKKATSETSILTVGGGHITSYCCKRLDVARNLFFVISFWFCIGREKSPREWRTLFVARVHIL